MMLKRIYVAAIGAMVVMLGFQSCDNTDDNSNTARVQLKLVDAPGDYLEVNVNIVDVQYNNGDTEEGWKSFGNPDAMGVVDLTTLIAGDNLLLADQIIPSGMLKQIRLVLGDGNELKIEGEVEGQGEMMSLNTPSAMQSGLKLNLNTTLEPGFSYTFILDWDVQKSVVMTGSGMYNLKPVIRVNAEVNSGSIKGNVVEMLNAVETPVDEATINFVNKDDANDLGSTSTDASGNFLIQGLKGATYTITVQKTGYQDSTPTDVSVNFGNVTTMGKITLTPTI